MWGRGRGEGGRERGREGGDGEEQEKVGEKRCSKLCSISVNRQPLTLINLPFSLLGRCVCMGGGEGGGRVRKEILCYHICTWLYTN